MFKSCNAYYSNNENTKFSKSYKYCYCCDCHQSSSAYFNTELNGHVNGNVGSHRGFIIQQTTSNCCYKVRITKMIWNYKYENV